MLARMPMADPLTVFPVLRALTQAVARLPAARGELLGGEDGELRHPVMSDSMQPTRPIAWPGAVAAAA